MNMVDILGDWMQREPGLALLLIFSTILVISLLVLLPDLIGAFREWKAEAIKAANEAMFAPVERLRKLRESDGKNKALPGIFLTLILQPMIEKTVWAVDTAYEAKVVQEFSQGRSDIIITTIAAIVIVVLVVLILFYLPWKKREKEIERRHLNRSGL